MAQCAGGEASVRAEDGQETHPDREGCGRGGQREGGTQEAGTGEASAIMSTFRGPPPPASYPESRYGRIPLTVGKLSAPFAGYVSDVGDRADDPVDHARTTRKHAGQNWKNTAALPGLLAVGVSSGVIFAALYAFATSHTAVGIILAAIAVILVTAGLGWLARESRRIRRVEAQYLRDHPDADAQPPAS